MCSAVSVPLWQWGHVRYPRWICCHLPCLVMPPVGASAQLCSGFPAARLSHSQICCWCAEAACRGTHTRCSAAACWHHPGQPLTATAAAAAAAATTRYPSTTAPPCRPCLPAAGLTLTPQRLAQATAADTLCVSCAKKTAAGLGSTREFQFLPGERGGEAGREGIRGGGLNRRQYLSAGVFKIRATRTAASSPPVWYVAAARAGQGACATSSVSLQ